MVRRGSAFRSSTAESYDPFDPTIFPVSINTAPRTPRETELINHQRLVVNYMFMPEDDTMRISLKGAAMAEPQTPLWKQLATKIGEAYYPAELMTDSRSALLGTPSHKRRDIGKLTAKSLAALESVEGAEPTSPNSNEGSDKPEENVSSDDSIGGEDYSGHRDFEDEGAREDDYEDERGGGDGDEF
jgi:hypothetical protein